MKLSEHIDTKYDHVLCPCCGKGAKDFDKELFQMFESLREFLKEAFGKEVFLKISSGFRCRAYNLNLKKRGYPASSSSRHLFGKAFDVQPVNISAKELVKIAVALRKKNKILTGGLGLYDWGIHFDTDKTLGSKTGKTRFWDYRS